MNKRLNEGQQKRVVWQCKSEEIVSSKSRPGESGNKVMAANIHGLPVQLWMPHDCACLHILS